MAERGFDAHGHHRTNALITFKNLKISKSYISMFSKIMALNI
jgi:hypothetical protein